MLRYNWLATITIGLVFVAASAQKAPHVANKQISPNVYEDNDVRILIPAGWSRASGPQPSLHASDVVGAGLSDIAPIQLPGTLLLQKDGYTLGIGYKTDHASGIVGGRIIEIFEIPWDIPNGDNWGCLGILTRVPQPASRSLLFENLIVNTEDEKIRGTCGISKDLGNYLTDRAAEQRWYGGYFTTDGGYFFDEDHKEKNCGSKAFSLTTTAKTPEQLPLANDKHLEQIVQEAMNIVDSVQYKRCAIAITSPLSSPDFNPGLD